MSVMMCVDKQQTNNLVGLERWLSVVIVIIMSMLSASSKRIQGVTGPDWTLCSQLLACTSQQTFTEGLLCAKPCPRL